ncbi:hypothetical protein [Paenibacillus alginolyticus]|uniref:hypothetical protein n=1 Tax=Paenibacillus alginolyticus TaxID=59839 RepID=UPI00398B4A9C
MAVDSKYLQILPDEIFPAHERVAWANRLEDGASPGRRLQMLLKHLLPPRRWLLLLFSLEAGNSSLI